MDLTLFNWPSYLNLWADESAVYDVKDFEIQAGDAELSPGVKLNALNRRITSLYIDLSFHGKDRQRIEIIYKDEASIQRHRATLYPFSPRSRHIAILPHGKVSEIGIYSNTPLQIDNVRINSAIPVKIFLLRIAILGVLLFAICLWMNSKTREKLRYFLFDYPVDAICGKQRKLYWSMVFSFILLCLFTALTGWAAIEEDKAYFMKLQGVANAYPSMADALLKG
ncbi:MAG: hypothetical protein LBF93_02605 [Zoogloeaceae bacterium]|nr:hypothetical protein [Zoogloeaceae bacterium]